MRAYSQATYYDYPEQPLPPCIVESQLRLKCAQQGQDDALWRRCVDLYGAMNPGKRVRADGVVNFVSLLIGIIGLTDVQSLCLALPGSFPAGPTEWQFRSVNDIAFFAFQHRRSKRCAERHLARLITADLVQTRRSRRTTALDGRIISLTSIRALLPFVFDLCRTKALYIKDCQHKAKQRQTAQDQVMQRRLKQISDAMSAPRARSNLPCPTQVPEQPRTDKGPEPPPWSMTLEQAQLALEQRQRESAAAASAHDD